MNFAQARYNSSAQGRFTSADSFGGSASDPQSLNRYAYVNNNAVNLSDPTGHMPSIHGNPGPSDSGYDGGGESWDNPNGPQAVLQSLGYTSADIIASTQFSTLSPQNDFTGHKGDNPVGGDCRLLELSAGGG